MKCSACAAILLTAACFAQTPQFEVDAGIWRTSVRGELQSGILPVDLHTDAALRDTWKFFGTASVRIGGKHRIVVQGSPLAFKGSNTLSRTITYNNRTYVINDQVETEADLTYFFAGHQWDFLSRERGSLGLRSGVAYLDATGSISSATTGITASSGYRVGLPLVGFAGQSFVAGRVLELHGDIHGMYLGGFGHYVQGGVGAGVWFGPAGIRATYRFLDADVHERGSADVSRIGVAPRIKGPVISAVFRLP